MPLKLCKISRVRVRYGYTSAQWVLRRMEPPLQHRVQLKNLPSCTDQYYYLFILRQPLASFRFFLLFFFLHTYLDWLQGDQEHLEYGGRPALHTVEPTAMDCPSGPFRSQFLMFKPFFSLSTSLYVVCRGRNYRLAKMYNVNRL